MTGDWAEELGDNWVTVSPGIYVHVEDLKAEPVPKLRVTESAAVQSVQTAESLQVPPSRRPARSPRAVHH